MIYYTKNKILHTISGELFKLNKSEHKLLICLSNNTCVTYAEIQNYVDRTNIPRLISRLRKKGLNIITRKEIGYLLKDELYFT